MRLSFEAVAPFQYVLLLHPASILPVAAKLTTPGSTIIVCENASFPESCCLPLPTPIISAATNPSNVMQTQYPYRSRHSSGFAIFTDWTASERQAHRFAPVFG